MGLPASVIINEVGPREGFQIETGPIPTEKKVELINALSRTGLKKIEAVSFVSPKWVPQMADADEVMAQIDRVEGVAYTATYLNKKGLERALANKASVEGTLIVAASETFSKKNMNRTTAEMLLAMAEWIETYQSAGIRVKQMDVMTAFGCNYEGYIYLDRVLYLIETVMRIAEEHGEKIEIVKLADTMGWANPEQMKRTIHGIKNKWPHLEIVLHLHDTRGLGLANANAAMQEGVRIFDAAVAGLGGCPFAAVKGAPGNICTEDFAFLCEEQGVATGLDLEALIECARLAERIVGRELPGHLSKGGRLSHIRPLGWKQAQGNL